MRIHLVGIAREVEVHVPGDGAERLVLGPADLERGLVPPLGHRLAHRKAGQEVLRQHHEPDVHAVVLADEALAARHRAAHARHVVRHALPGAGAVGAVVDAGGGDLQREGGVAGDGRSGSFV